ncbi:hypothetical protein [Actinoplanes awajinensis]|uniref:Uncharacterized protein n=1 Tax=Actinoplanes awajinensis subsp. mycoplanecinus TaxID=135947 RepID=A0A101JC68_9ACTN|nr:hypothetical protein [Actinoplanes awajinensis]KUL24096.1 hypothetical protein ADL15_44205 [Actinoplanes awajinensis subsp. mycoplanecinus]
MQQIEITHEGVSVTSRSDPLMSLFGTEMRPGVTDVVNLPWAEITRITLTRFDVPPGYPRSTSLEIDVAWGEYVTVHEDAEGFAAAVRELCRLSGRPITEDGPIWPAPDGS